MTKAKKASLLRGRLMRATMLDRSGRPIYGDSSVVTTEGFITASMTTSTEEGEAITVTKANGNICVSEPGAPSFSGFGAEIEFCDVDFALFEILTGQPVVLDAYGVIIGITETTSVDLTGVNFALELWLGAVGNTSGPSANADGQWGYMLMPFVGGGVIGDVSVANAAISFTVTGMKTKDGGRWGAGPHNVELVAGVPAPLSTPMGPKDHRRTQFVEVAPPEVFVGATPLLDPSTPAVTSIAIVATGLSAKITPTPAGGPMWYTFGDGEWDYSETGAYTHEYKAAGTYTVVGHRGKTKATKAVKVTTP